jgi:hypothetical protein
VFSGRASKIGGNFSFIRHYKIDYRQCILQFTADSLNMYNARHSMTVRDTSDEYESQNTVVCVTKYCDKCNNNQCIDQL